MISRLSALLIPAMLAATYAYCGGVNGTTIYGAINDSDESSRPSATFHVTFTDEVNTKELLDGDPIDGTIKEDLKLNGHIIAPSGSEVIGHVEELTVERKHHDSGTKVRKKPLFILKFDRIVTPDKIEIPMAALVPKQFAVFNNSGTYRQITIGPDGELLKTESLDSYVVPEIDLAISKSILQIHSAPLVMAGDEVAVEAIFPRLISKKN